VTAGHARETLIEAGQQAGAAPVVDDPVAFFR
jgi:hypothetical protein